MPGPYSADDIRRVLDNAALGGAAWARMQLPGVGAHVAWVLAGYHLALCVLAVAFGLEWKPGKAGGRETSGKP